MHISFGHWRSASVICRQNGHPLSRRHENATLDKAPLRQPAMWQVFFEVFDAHKHRHEKGFVILRSAVEFHSCCQHIAGHKCLVRKAAPFLISFLACRLRVALMLQPLLSLVLSA